MNNSHANCGICKRLDILNSYNNLRWGSWESSTSPRAHLKCIKTIQECETKILGEIVRSLENPIDRRRVHITMVDEIEKATNSTVMEVYQNQGKEKLENYFNHFGSKSISDLLKKKESENNLIRKWSKL